MELYDAADSYLTPVSEFTSRNQQSNVANSFQDISAGPGKKILPVKKVRLQKVVSRFIQTGPIFKATLR